METSTPATSRSLEDAEPLTLFHYGPTETVPSASSFALKLETYLRMTAIPYKQEFSLKSSSKGKVPFIKHQGKEIADSNFIIPYLNEKFSKDLNSSLNDAEKAISLAFQRLIEENLYWTIVHYRWIENWSTYSLQIPISGLWRTLFRIAGPILVQSKIKSNLNGHGMGRHTVAEIGMIMEKDLKALSLFLGDKPFFMGDVATEVDASLFGLIAQFVYDMPNSPHGKLIQEKFQNLLEYTNRMKTRYFKDWESKLLHGKKTEDPDSTPEYNEIGGAAASSQSEITHSESEGGGARVTTGNVQHGTDHLSDEVKASMSDVSETGDAKPLKE